jgi:hypothetical protein
MKKLLSLVVVAGLAALVACGPSAEEKAAAEKAKQDSIAKVEKEKAMQDSIAAADLMKAKEDSIAKAKQDSIAAAQPVKGGKKPEVKAGEGKK